MVIALMVLVVVLALLIGGAAGAILTIQYALTGSEKSALAARMRGGAGPLEGGAPEGGGVPPVWRGSLTAGPAYFEAPDDKRPAGRTA